MLIVGLLGITRQQKAYKATQPNQAGQVSIAKLPGALDAPAITQHQRECRGWFRCCTEFHSGESLR
jgi:hypothetical protein